MNEELHIKTLLLLAREDLSNRNFEDNVIEKIEYRHLVNLIRKKNIRLSWICLLVSAALFPIGIMVFTRIVNFALLQKLGFSMENVSSILIPASVLITAIIILLQIDNLLRLSFQARN